MQEEICSKSILISLVMTQRISNFHLMVKFMHNIKKINFDFKS